MTLLEIKTVAASYHEKSIADLTVNGIDLFLVAANQAKQTASQLHDFGFQRKMLTVTVNSATGGDLATAVVLGTETAATVKTVLDVGRFDTHGNFFPQEWTTAEASQTEQRQEDRFHSCYYRYPTDAQYHSHLIGERRLTFRGDTLMFWPLCTENPTNVTIGIDAFVADADWTAVEIVEDDDTTTPVSDVWTTTGAQYIQWQSICSLNKLFKTFVNRQEGNVTEPQQLANDALQSFIDQDVFKYEQSRRHGR